MEEEPPVRVDGYMTSSTVRTLSTQHERPYTHTNAERASLKESVKVNARS